MLGPAPGVNQGGCHASNTQTSGTASVLVVFADIEKKGTRPRPQLFFISS